MLIVDGMPVHVVADGTLPEKQQQFRFSKSKKKRIVKKFSRKITNYKLIESAYSMYGQIFISQKMYKKIKSQQIKKAASDENNRNI